MRLGLAYLLVAPLHLRWPLSRERPQASRGQVDEGIRAMSLVTRQLVLQARRDCLRLEPFKQNRMHCLAEPLQLRQLI